MHASGRGVAPGSFEISLGAPASAVPMPPRPRSTTHPRRDTFPHDQPPIATRRVALRCDRRSPVDCSRAIALMCLLEPPGRLALVGKRSARYRRVGAASTASAASHSTSHAPTLARLMARISDISGRSTSQVYARFRVESRVISRPLRGDRARSRRPCTWRRRVWFDRPNRISSAHAARRSKGPPAE